MVNANRQPREPEEPGAEDRPPAQSLTPGFNNTFIRYPDRIVDEGTGRTVLIEAIINGDIDQVGKLIDAGASLNKPTRDGRAPLHYAARLGAFDIAGLLIEGGAQVNARDKNLETPLFDALGCAEPLLMIDLLLEAGASPDIPDADGRVPLHAAAESAPVSVIRALAGVTDNPNRPDKKGYQPLHRACEKNTVEAVQAIMFERVAIFSACLDGDTCLHLAAARSDSTDVAEYLLKTEAAQLVNAVNLNGRSPLHFAVLHGREKLASAMLEIGANVNLADNHGATPLHDAAELNNLALARLLVGQGADVAKNARPHRMTPLILAIRAGAKEIVGLLLERDADPSADGDDGLTPLMAAANKPSPEIVGLLLGSGADARAKDKNGRNVLQHCADDLPAEILTKLIDAGAAVDNRDDWQRTPLISAIMDHNTALAGILLDKGADANAKDDQGNSPVHCALTYRKPEVLDLLLKKGADPNITDKWNNQTALNLACSLNLETEVGRLLEAGADPNLADSQGHTPLHTAIQNSWSSAEAVRLLLQKGADPLIRDNGGHTPYDMAVSLDKSQATEFIRQHLKAKGIEAEPEHYNPYSGYPYGF